MEPVCFVSSLYQFGWSMCLSSSPMVVPICSPEGGEAALQPYQFRMEEIEALRYRCRVSEEQRGLGGAGTRPCHTPK